MADAINPEHYSYGGIQPYEFMKMKFTPEEYRGFLKGNIIKYIARAGYKQGEAADKDAKKAQWYTEKLVEFLQEQGKLHDTQKDEKASLGSDTL